MASQKTEETEGVDLGSDSLGSPVDGNTLNDGEKKTDSDDIEPARHSESKQVDVPPDGGYGWVCVACVFLINGHTWGVNSVSQSPLSCFYQSLIPQSYGIFLAHYLANNTFPGATSLEYAFVGGLSISLALLMSPVATICTRKHGTQVTLGIGILFETVGLLGASCMYKSRFESTFP